MKKILKFLKITLGTLVIIIVLTSLYFCISNSLFMGSKNQSNLEYLTVNKIELHSSEIDTTLFDTAFYESKVFLLGEVHGFAANQIVDLDLFIFLNKKVGVRYYIAEMDSVTAFQLNKYLNNAKFKDAMLLKNVVNAIGNRIPQQASTELYQKWSLLYDYNKNLATTLKIKVLGIDKNFDDDTSKLSRDESMLLNFQNYVTRLHLENEKCYGLFGFFHTLQSGTTAATTPFATQLKQTGTKITSIVSFPIDSEMYVPKNPNYPSPNDHKLSWMNADGPLMLVEGINDLKILSNFGANTLFKINTKNTPYINSQNLINIKSLAFAENIIPNPEKNTTDYFQYALITRNSKALTKLD